MAGCSDFDNRKSLRWWPEFWLSVAPTVLGMVQAFFNMSQAGNNIDITLLSSGIYTAMITTVGGLIVGILAYFGYNYLTSNISDIVFKMENATIDFMDLLQEPAADEKQAAEN